MAHLEGDIWGAMPQLDQAGNPELMDVAVPPFSPMVTRLEATELINAQLTPLLERIARLERNEARFRRLEQDTARLQQENAELRASLAALEENGAPASPAGDRPLKMKLPDTYEGDRSALQDWLDQIALYQYGNMRYALESRKVAFTLSLLRGNALKWARPILADLSGPSPPALTHEDLVKQLKAAFSEVDAPAVAADKMLGLKQGSGSVADYAAKFRQYKSQAGWGQDNAAYISIFRKGLSSTVLQHIAGKEPERVGFDDFVNWVAQVDERLRSAGVYGRGGNTVHTAASRSSHVPRTPAAPAKNPDAMDVDKARRFNGNCYTCGQPGHQSRFCKQKKQTNRAATATVEEVPATAPPAVDPFSEAIKAMIDKHMASRSHEWRSPAASASNTSSPATTSTPSSESTASSPGF